MLDKINVMMYERRINKSELAKGAGIPYTTIDSLFRKGFENTRYPTLRKLAVFFDVSMEYLINDEEDDRDYGKIMPNDISKEEHRLISLWRKMSHEEQLKMLGRIELTLEK